MFALAIAGAVVPEKGWSGEEAVLAITATVVLEGRWSGEAVVLTIAGAVIAEGRWSVEDVSMIIDAADACCGSCAVEELSGVICQSLEGFVASTAVNIRSWPYATRLVGLELVLPEYRSEIMEVPDE